MNHRQILILALAIACSLPAASQIPLRTKLGQMVMVTVTGDSVEESSPSMDTLKSDLAENLIGGVIMFTWSGNLKSPEQISHFTGELQKRAAIPLFLAIDQEGGSVARLSASNGFAATASAYDLGTVLNQEGATRATAATMANWFVQTGLTMNLAPVVDLNVNPASPAIGALKRSFSADPAVVVRHASWFIDEFHKKSTLTTLKHFPGHGSAASDSHLGFTDITTTWSAAELQPYAQLIAVHAVDAVMTGHLFNATIDSLYPATLSYATITGLLRNQLGYPGVVISDEMSMKAISSYYGLDEAMVLAVKAGVDILLYNKNRDSSGNSLARRVVDVLERSVRDGVIPESRIDASYARIMELKGAVSTAVPLPAIAERQRDLLLTNYPNPFNPVTTIAYRVPEAGHAVFTIVDLLGRAVATVADSYHSAGLYTVRFDGSHLASGIYLCRLETAQSSVTRRIVLLR